MIMLCLSIVSQNFRPQTVEKCGVLSLMGYLFTEIKYLKNLAVLWYMCLESILVALLTKISQRTQNIKAALKCKDLTKKTEKDF